MVHANPSGHISAKISSCPESGPGFTLTGDLIRPNEAGLVSIPTDDNCLFRVNVAQVNSEAD
jgi:hypothetical protein